MKTIVLTALLTFSVFISYAQTLKGSAKLLRTESRSESWMDNIEVNEAELEKAKYGNVEAYDRNNNLVGSVLTDADGNYTLNFSDTGTYQIKVMYAGFETVEETVVVDEEDVKADVTLVRDASKKERKLSERVYSLDAGFLGEKIMLSENNAQLNKENEGDGLTSGEINDFAKWDLWNDYLADDLKSYQEQWKLNPQNRYVLQLMNKEKNPLVGATVSLLGNDGQPLWVTVTDNTGKAELWGTINQEDGNAGLIRVDYNGNIEEIKRPKPFKKGINTLKIDESCGASNIVDIAFVVDATGSMSDEINFIKRDVNKVMYEAQNLYSDVAMRYGSVFYRDKGEDYVTKHKDFTNVLSEALVFVDEQFAGGGGDMPEAVDEGLDVAINQLSWSEDARAKLLFLILDAPAHTEEANLARIQSLSKEAAKKGIKIIPITGSGINKSGEYLMRAMALCTNGTYVFLTDHSGIGFSHIEPTIDEYDVQLLTKRMTSIIKTNIFYPECEETVPEFEMNYPDSVVEFSMEQGQIDPHTKDSTDTEDRDTSNVQEIEDIQKIEWKYYPNPTRDWVHIEAPQEIEFIYLTDLTGKILQRVSFEGQTKVSLYLGDYPVGIYLLRYPLGKQWVTGKVVLAR